MKILLLIMCSFCYLNAHADVQLVQVSNNTQSILKSTYLNGNLLYTDADKYLWKYETSSLNLSQVELNNKQVQTNNLISSTDMTYFINLMDNNSLWETNGVTFSKLSQSAFSTLFMSEDERVFAIDNSFQKLSIIQNSQLKEISIAPLYFQNSANSVLGNFCYIDEENFIFDAYEDSTGNSGRVKYYFYKAGTISELDLGNEVDYDTLRFEIKHKNKCYFTYYIGSLVSKSSIYWHK